MLLRTKSVTQYAVDVPEAPKHLISRATPIADREILFSLERLDYDEDNEH
ncbi:MAG: hypothetical protein WC551_07765 [Patescibacteria group bacterium]